MVSNLVESHPCSSDAASVVSSNESSDLEPLIKCLPHAVQEFLEDDEDAQELVEVVMDVGRFPEIHFNDHFKTLEISRVTREDLQQVVSMVGKFGGDNRAGIEGTLHRVSCLRNRSGDIVGLTLRVGKAVVGPAGFLTDMIKEKKSILFLGFPGVGKTTAIRDVARASGDLGRRVIIVDSSNEIGGDGDVPHRFIGRARRIQVPKVEQQFDVMIEAVQNHRPEMIVVDEVGRRKETDACRSIAERGVQIIATAHGDTLESLMNNPEVVGLLGGIGSVIVGDQAARERSNGGGGMARKSTLERQRPPVFGVVVEMRDRDEWVIHDAETSVDNILRGKNTEVEVRCRDHSTGGMSVSKKSYSANGCLNPLETPNTETEPQTVQALDCRTIVTPVKNLVKIKMETRGWPLERQDITYLSREVLLEASEGMGSILQNPEKLKNLRTNDIKGEWLVVLPHLRNWITNTFLARGGCISSADTQTATLFLAGKMSTRLGNAFCGL